MGDITLSEAIRLGAALKPQCKGGRMDGVGSCALSAASEAVGIPGHRDRISRFRSVHYAALAERFPLLRMPVQLPASTRAFALGIRLPLYEAIYILNDIVEWSREHIADWVEGIERQQGVGEVIDVEVVS